MQFVLQLRLQVGQLLLKDLYAHQHDVLRLEGAARLHAEVELVGLGGVVVLGLVLPLLPLLVRQLGIVRPVMKL